MNDDDFSEYFGVDVDADDVIAYDSEGRKIWFFVEAGRWFDRVTLQTAEEIPNHAAELHQALKGYLTQMGVEDEWLSKASLGELLNKAREEYCGSRKGCFSALRRSK